MKLFIVACILFSIVYIEVFAKIKVAQHGKSKGNSHQHIEKLSGYAPEIQTKKNYCSLKLPYDGGILNANSEYIPGTRCTSK